MVVVVVVVVIVVAVGMLAPLCRACVALGMFALLNTMLLVPLCCWCCCCVVAALGVVGRGH